MAFVGYGPGDDGYGDMSGNTPDDPEDMGAVFYRVTAKQIIVHWKNADEEEVGRRFYRRTDVGRIAAQKKIDALREQGYAAGFECQLTI